MILRLELFMPSDVLLQRYQQCCSPEKDLVVRLAKRATARRIWALAEFSAYVELWNSDLVVFPGSEL